MNLLTGDFEGYSRGNKMLPSVLLPLEVSKCPQTFTNAPLRIAFKEFTPVQ